MCALMAKGFIFLFVILMHFPAHSSSTIYKCMSEGRVVFSENVCPEEFRQHKIEYQHGITTEIDSDKRKVKKDPLLALLNKETVDKEKLLQLLDAEIYRLKQENSYFEILRTSEIQKLDRSRYWQANSKDDPSYGLRLNEINKKFKDMVLQNLSIIQVLNQHKVKINSEAAPDEYMSQ